MRPKGAIADFSHAAKATPVDSNEPLTASPTVEPVSSPEVPSSESINVWPDEAAETAFLSETREVSVLPAPKLRPVEDDEATMPLPKLDELVNRIPAESRELLEELFRAKFTGVRRIKASDLKN